MIINNPAEEQALVFNHTNADPHLAFTLFTLLFLTVQTKVNKELTQSCRG